MKPVTANLLTVLLSGILFTLAIDWPEHTLAQAPDALRAQRQFVYGAKTFSGQDYDSKLYPPTVDTLYLLADVTNIVSPRYTHIFYWPLTKEYSADWDSLNETVRGTLEILQGGRLLHTISQTKYAIQYPQGPDTGEVYLYTGAEAEARYMAFEQQKQVFRDEVAAYHEAVISYRQQDVAKGSPNEVPLPPPEEPAPFLFLSTGVYDGFPVKLPAGTYAIRLRGEEGQIVPGSEKALIVFSPRREGTGYTIIPQDKWTVPETSAEPGQVIYARSGSIIYLQPFAEKEYNEVAYARLDAPQSSFGSHTQWTWVSLQSKDEGYVELLQGDQVIEQVARKAYVVKQRPGLALGYEILLADETQRSRPPDFEGYKIEVRPDQPSFSIRLMDAEGNLVPGSEREIRLLDQDYTTAHFLLPLLPLFVGISLTLWRQRKFSLRSLRLLR